MTFFDSIPDEVILFIAYVGAFFLLCGAALLILAVLEEVLSERGRNDL